MITDRDMKIIRYLEQYKYATLEHLQKIFFKHQKNGYNIARRRMAEIKKAGYVKVERHMEIGNRLLFMYNEKGIKLPTRHRLILLDLLANLHYLDFNVREFTIEKRWMDGKIRSDAFLVFTIENVKKRRQFFVEVITSNNYHNLEKYDTLLETDEVYKYLGRNVTPKILLISDRDFGDIKLKHTEVIKLNLTLDNLATIIL